MSRLIILSIALLALAGCAAQRAFDQGRELIDAGKIPEGSPRSTKPTSSTCKINRIASTISDSAISPCSATWLSPKKRE